jgi:hypothetical protein
MNKITSFGNPLKVGKNQDVLRKGSIYFYSQHGTSIKSYMYTRDTSLKRRNSRTLPKSNLECCKVCGAKLYKEHDPDEKGNFDISEKKHLVFIDSDGEVHKTCYGLNHCFKLANFDPESVEVEDQDASFEAIYRGIRFPDENAFHISVLEDFESNVRPFIDKWSGLAVSKLNIMEFISDAERITYHLRFHNEDDASLLLYRIYRCIGVNV